MSEPLVFEVKEKSSGSYTAHITDEDGLAIPLATISTLTLTLYVINADGTTTIVNSRDAQNILNANNVVVEANGQLTWTLQVGDTTLVLNTLPYERHIALFQWTWPTAKAGKHEVVFAVKNLLLVT